MHSFSGSSEVMIFKLSLSDEQWAPIERSSTMWCFTAVTFSGYKKDIRVSNVSRVLLCFSLIPFGPLCNMKAPNPFLLVYSEGNVIMSMFSSIHTHCLPSATEHAFYWPVRVIFSQIKTQFKDLSTTDLVQGGRWKAPADRRITGLSAGAHRGHCSPCTLAFSLLATVASSPSAIHISVWVIH